MNREPDAYALRFDGKLRIAMMIFATEDDAMQYADEAYGDDWQRRAEVVPLFAGQSTTVTM